MKLINEAKRMQQLAGLITESQLNEEVKSVDQALDNSKVQAVGEKLAQNPALLQKAMGELSKLGIDKNTLVKAAQAYKAGQSVDSIIEPKITAATEKINEISFDDDTIPNVKRAGGFGAILGAMGAGLAGSSPSGIAMLAGAVILGLIGAGLATLFSIKEDSEDGEY